MTHVIAIVVALLYTSAVAAQDAPAPARFVTAEPVPSVYRKLVWEQTTKTADGTTIVISSVGYWYTVEQVAKTAARIDYLEQKAAKECVDTTIAEVKHNVPWLWVGIGVVVGGTAGYFIGKAIR